MFVHHQEMNNASWLFDVFNDKATEFVSLGIKQNLSGQQGGADCVYFTPEIAFSMSASVRCP